jgi:hypothetical protein
MDKAIIKEALDAIRKEMRGRMAKRLMPAKEEPSLAEQIIGNKPDESDAADEVDAADAADDALKEAVLKAIQKKG